MLYSAMKADEENRRTLFSCRHIEGRLLCCLCHQASENQV